MIFAPLDAGLYGRSLSKQGTIVATLMAQDLLSNGDDPNRVLADVRDLLTEVDQIMSEGKPLLSDPNWNDLQVKWCLSSPILLKHLQKAERMLSQTFPRMVVPALVILCAMSIFLNSRRSTLDLNLVSVPKRTSEVLTN